MTFTPTRSARPCLDGLGDDGLLDVVEAALGRLRGLTLSGAVSDAALGASVRRLQRCESAVYAEKLRRLHEVAERESFRADRERSVADWAGAQLGLSPAEARVQVRDAAALDRMPATAQRLFSGQITAGHVGAAAQGLAVLDRAATDVAADAGDDVGAWRAAQEQAAAAVAALDAFVAEHAPGQGPKVLAQRVGEWTVARDPGAVRDRERRGLAKRGLWFDDAPDADGLYAGRFRGTAAHLAQVKAAVGALARKTGAHDDRTPAQRRVDALATLARRACDAGALPVVGGQRPHVAMVTSREAQAGDPSARPAHVAGVGAVSADTARFFACDADTTEVVIDEVGKVWDVGHADGDPSPVQRTIVFARDVVCVGCGTEASRCQIHHIRHRSHGGPTVVENLVLVCWSCHQGLHHLGWRVAKADGRYRIDKYAGAAPDAGAADGAGRPGRRDTGPPDNRHRGARRDRHRNAHRSG